MYDVSRIDCSRSEVVSLRDFYLSKQSWSARQTACGVQEANCSSTINFAPAMKTDLLWNHEMLNVEWKVAGFRTLQKKSTQSFHISSVTSWATSG